MNLGPLSFPVDDDVRAALQELPNLARAMALERVQKSPLELVRLLGNAEVPSNKALLIRLDHSLSTCGHIWKHILTATNPFQLEQALAEAYLLWHLQAIIGAKSRAVAEQPGLRTPDIEVTLDRAHAVLEVYSPVDFAGSRQMSALLVSGLTYIRTPRQLDLLVEVRARGNDARGSDRFRYPAHVPDGPALSSWYRDFTKAAGAWLSEAHPGAVRTFEGPGSIVDIIIEIQAVCEGRGPNGVTMRYSTRSTDTREAFERLSPEEFAISAWGRRLQRKLQSRQAGDAEPGLIRALVVNFALTDTSDRGFISTRQYSASIGKYIEYVAMREPLAYDVVVPAVLGMSCRFGPAVILDRSRSALIADFVTAARIDEAVTVASTGDSPGMLEGQDGP